jgi:hypothetical protein
MKTKNMKNLLIAAGIAIGISATAQKDTLRFNMNGNEVIILTDDINKLSTTDINGMVNYLNIETKRITADFNERVAALNKQYEDGEISEEQYEARMEMEVERFEIKMEELSETMEEWSEEYSEKYEEWADEYGERWEKWADEYSDSWESWAEQWEEDAEKRDGKLPPPMPPPPSMPKPEIEDGTTIRITPDGIEIEEGGEQSRIEYKIRRRNKQARTEGQGDIHFGWNNMISGDAMVKNIDGVGGELRPWQSTVFTLGGAGKTRVGNDNSKFYVRYGLQFNWHHFRLKGDNILTKVALPEDGAAFLPAKDINPNITNVAFSSYNATYIDAPVMMILDFSKKGMDNAFNFGVGGYGGVRIAQKRNLIYDDFNNDPIKERTRNNFYMNTWRYGVLAQIGFNAFKITGKYDLSEFFRSDKATPDYQIGSIAFGFSF